MKPIETVMLVGEAVVAGCLLWYLNTREAKLFQTEQAQ